MVFEQNVRGANEFVEQDGVGSHVIRKAIEEIRDEEAGFLSVGAAFPELRIVRVTEVLVQLIEGVLDISSVTKGGG